jgi:hypothetical protein
MSYGDNLENNQIIFNKNGFKIVKQEGNSYVVSFDIENSNIYIEKIVNFKFLDIVFQVNKDIIDSYSLEILKEDENESQGNAVITLKHLFSDLGLPQKYLNTRVVMKKNVGETLTTFHIKNTGVLPEIEKLNEIEGNNYELFKLRNVIIYCKYINEHKMNVEYNIYYPDSFVLSPILEKIICSLVYKIFIRTKLFIEMYR